MKRFVSLSVIALSLLLSSLNFAHAQTYSTLYSQPIDTVSMGGLSQNPHYDYGVYLKGAEQFIFKEPAGYHLNYGTIYIGDVPLTLDHQDGAIPLAFYIFGKIKNIFV